MKKWLLDNQLQTETVIFLSLSWLYPRNLALNNWFIWSLIRLIKKYQVRPCFSFSSDFFGTVSNNVSDIFSTISAPIPHNGGNPIGIKKNLFEYSQAPK